MSSLPILTQASGPVALVSVKYEMPMRDNAPFARSQPLLYCFLPTGSNWKLQLAEADATVTGDVVTATSRAGFA